MQKFDQENVEALLVNLGLSVDNYFFAMTRPSLLSRAVIGNIVDFANRYCIISFSETEINLIMLSRLSNKNTTELIKINRNEIVSAEFSSILISYMLYLKTNESSMKFQVFKKFGKFNKISASLELFKRLYVNKG